MADVFLVALLAAAATEAVWIDRRFRRYMPETFGKVAAHLAAGVVACVVVAPLAIARLTSLQTFWGTLAAIVGVALVCLTYGLLGAIWGIRLTQRMIPPGLR